jgi:phage I-like protein
MPTICAPLAVTGPSVPDWVHLLPSGTIGTRDGRGPFKITDCKALLKRSMAAGKFLIDENHSTDLFAPNGGPAPAQGWVVELQSRNDGIWGRVEWTKIGRAIMEDRRYRGISPVIAHRADGSILSILRASLTNTPNLTGLSSLHSGTTANVSISQLIRQVASIKHRIARLSVDGSGFHAEHEISPAEADVLRALGVDRAAFIATKQKGTHESDTLRAV